MPYHKARLQGDIDEEMIKSLQPPHWKQENSTNLKNSNFHPSDKVLGKMWNLMKGALDDAVQASTRENKPEQRIVDHPRKCVELRHFTEDDAAAMRRRAMNALDECEKVISQRRSGKTNEDINADFDEFCEKQKQYLIDAAPSMTDKNFRAAVLYEQAARKWQASNANKWWIMQFPWKVAQDYLCNIASDCSIVENGTNCLPLPLHEDMRGQFFNKKGGTVHKGKPAYIPKSK